MIRRLYSKLPENIKEKIRLFRLKHRSLKKPLKNSVKVEKTIVVLGMHRSGTSLTTNILQELGINVGERLGEASSDNEKGFFENEDFIEMNDKILALAGGSWKNPPSPEKILALKRNKRLMSEIESLIRNQEDKIWAWKDPRTTLTIELYFPFLKNPYFIICRRNSMAIAKSLEKRNGFKIEKGLKLTSIYNNRLNEFLKKISPKMIELDYEEYFKNPEKKINEIGKFLGLKKKVKANKIVDKKLKHF